MEKLLAKLYYGRKTAVGFTGDKRKLYAEAKRKKDVVKCWRSQAVPTTYAPGKWKFPRAIIIAGYKNHIFQIDLADYARLAPFNRSYKYLLVVVDTFSRAIKGLYAQKTKTSAETAKNLASLFQIDTPSKVFSDKGTEFLGKCKEVYEKYGVSHYQSADVLQKSANVERAIRTIKLLLAKYIAAEGSLRWFDKLHDVMEQYNKTWHRVLKMTPLQASDPKNLSKVFRNTVIAKEMKLRDRKRLPYTYKVGDTVRVMYMEQKGYRPRWSDALYEVYKRERKSYVPVYYLREFLTKEPLRGNFYASEIQEVQRPSNPRIDIEKIYGYRFSSTGDKEVLVKKKQGERKIWVKYKALLEQE